MADINALIAQGVAPIQVANPLAQMAQIAQIQHAQNQNALAQYQLGAAQREEAAQNALSRAYQAAYTPETGGYDMGKLRGALISAGVGAKLPGIEKQMGELATQRLTQQKTESELQNARTLQYRDLLGRVSDPNSAAQWLEAQYRDPVIGPVVSRVPFEQAVSQIPSDPAAFADWKARNALGMAEYVKQNKPTVKEQNIGGTTRLMAVPGLGGAATVVPGSEAAKTMAPGEAERLAISRGQLAVAQAAERRQAAETELKDKVVAHTTTDEAGNVTLYNRLGQVIPAKDAEGAPAQIKGKPSATFEKTRAQREQLSKDLDTAIAELKDITKEGGLIDQSTGSGAGRLVDVAAQFVGQATPGAIATAKLKPIADLALKMVPRFEGPQSDKDTQSYKEAAGQLADPTLPSKIRKEAGKTVLRLMENRKGQFVTPEMAGQGTGAGGGVDTSNPLLK